MIGIDLVFMPEFQQQIENGGQAFLEKAFSAAELKNQAPEHLAGLWAAKEAVIKAAEVPPKKYTAIVITHGASGKPHARVGTQHYAISIAHHGDYAVAVATRFES